MAVHNRRYYVGKCAAYIFPVGTVIIGWLFMDMILQRMHINQPETPNGNGQSEADSPTVFLDSRFSNVTPRDSNCTFWRCFDPYRCNSYGDYRLTVYIYPWKKYFRTVNGTILSLTPTPSQEFVELVEAVRRSPYYEPNPRRACLFLPTVDTLNADRSEVDEVDGVLASLKWWNMGENHLLFNMLPGSFPSYDSKLGVHTGRAIVAGGGYSSVRTYRRTFDISIPVYNPSMKAKKPDFSRNRTVLLISTKPYPLSSNSFVLRRLQTRHPSDFLFLTASTDGPFDPFRRCYQKERGKTDTRRQEKIFRYPEIMQRAKFCLVLEGNRLGQPELSDALQFGCVPIVIIDEYVLPFSEVLDWKRAAVSIYRHQLPDIVDILRRDIGQARYETMQTQGGWFWKAYFSSLEKIALTTLRIIQDRVFPHQSRSYSEWNDNRQALFPLRPFPINRLAPNDGFTAVILTYDRLPSLFQQLRQLARVQSLAKIIVVWNNQQKAPPTASEWPKLNKPLKVIRTSENRLTNRFVPYNEIETEAVLSLDDDILMLNTDELEFGYQAWREFPSYLVGYPSRVHIFNPEKRSWTYESEWTNNASLILTGASFYHNYYNLLFTETMPARVKNWIDHMMNCEDIAMNFLIANNTGQPALKITPRKKFKPSDKVGQDLSADSAHLKQRSECLNRLSRYFGGMILKSVEFRLDPMLYKIDTVPDDMKLYPDVGPL